MRATARALSCLLVMTLGAVFGPAGSASAAGAAAEPSVASVVTLNVESGASYVWRPGSGEVVAGPLATDGYRVLVSGDASKSSFDLVFHAPLGQDLRVGTYELTRRDADQDRAGLDITGNGGGCNGTSGRFTVHDLSSDLSRLWLTYEMHCESGDPAIFGEVRINEPVDPALLLGAARVDWPGSRVGEAGRPVPVQLVNTGDQPETVRDAAVSTGGDDFSVLRNTCGVLAPEESCTVYVGFVPSRSGPREGVLTVHDSTPAGSHEVRLQGLGREGYTSWDMDSQDGEHVGDGDVYHFGPNGTAIEASGTESSVRVQAVSGDQRWDAEFAAGPGALLLPGTSFTDSDLFPTTGSRSAYLEVHGAGRGCNAATGTFTVQQATYRDGVMTGFALTFEQHCEGARAALYGSIAWQAPQPAASEYTEIEDVAPGPVTDVRAESREIGTLELRWENPRADDWSSTIIRKTLGTAPAASPTSGAPVYAGEEDVAQVSGLQPGQVYTFTFFTRDLNKNMGAPTSYTPPASVMNVVASRTALRFGTSTTLSGRLTDATGGRALGGRSVELWGAPLGRLPLVRVGATRTRADGGYTIVARPVRSTLYQVRYVGGIGRLSGSARRTVEVQPRVDLYTSRHSGATYVLTTVVAPSHGGQRVVLQRLVGRTWRQVAAAPLTAGSAADFRVRLGRGTSAYRVLKAADKDHLAAYSRVLRLRR